MRDNADYKHAFLTLWIQLNQGQAVPMPEGEYPFFISRNFRADWCFTEKRLIVEIDGGQWLKNGGGHNRDRDRYRSNYIAIAGFYLMRFSVQMLQDDPVQCINQVREFLELPPLD